MYRKKYCVFFILLSLLLLAAIVGCAAGPNTMENTARADGNIAGFPHGIWHGATLPFTFIISLAFDSVHFYEVYNNGNRYNIGFVIGLFVAVIYCGYIYVLFEAGISSFQWKSMWKKEE